MRCEQISFKIKTKIEAQLQPVLELLYPEPNVVSKWTNFQLPVRVFTEIGAAAAADNGAVKRCQAGDCSLQPSHS